MRVSVNSLFFTIREIRRRYDVNKVSKNIEIIRKSMESAENSSIEAKLSKAQI